MRKSWSLASLAFACLSFGPVLAGESRGDASSSCCTASSPEGTTGSCDWQGEPNDCGCGCDCDCWDNCDRFFGLAPSDHCFDSFVSPISNPFFFEDPRALTEVRGIFIDNSLPGGGDAHVLALQARGRLSDSWSVIAPRLADLEVHQSNNGSTGGFLSAPIGLKATLFRDVERQRILSGGMTFFIPGSQSAFSSFGDGDIHLFLSGGKQIGDCGHWLSGTGFRLPTDSNWGTQLWYWSNQWDYELPGHFYLLSGVNWFHWLKNAGNNFTGGTTGLDLINLPTAGVAGTDVVTGVIGLKWKPSCHCEVGSGFEFPLTTDTDILHNRVYADLIFRY